MFDPWDLLLILPISGLSLLMAFMGLRFRKPFQCFLGLTLGYKYGYQLLDIGYSRMELMAEWHDGQFQKWALICAISVYACLRSYDMAPGILGVMIAADLAFDAKDMAFQGIEWIELFIGVMVFSILFIVLAIPLAFVFTKNRKIALGMAFAYYGASTICACLQLHHKLIYTLMLGSIGGAVQCSGNLRQWSAVVSSSQHLVKDKLATNLGNMKAQGAGYLAAAGESENALDSV